MQAGSLVGLDIAVNKHEGKTVAKVSIYPHSITVEVNREEDFSRLFEKIYEAIADCVKYRHVQF